MSEATVRAAALEGWENFVTATPPEPHAPAASSRPCERAPGAISLAEFVRFSESVVDRTRDVAIPWLVGVHYDLGSLGVVGDAINAAGKVGTALRRLVDYFSLLQDCTDIRLDREEDMASVSYRILDPEIWPRHHDAMFSLGIVGQIIRRGTRGAWDKVEFAFEAEQYEMRGDIGKVVCAPCSFGADSNQIRFPAAMLDLALPENALGNVDVRQIGRTIVEQRRRTPLVERLAQVVYRDLNSHGIEQERIAREIGMSSRTMRRKLAEEGSSFQQVLDECRMRQALFEFRTRPDLSIAQIALRLGYAEHSNFTRAFHRWTGTSPHAWRASLARTAH
ncbi:MAG: AraC family transcriptional regulator ligand-binding domain-containing protein [Proteobacteria bacterium]|nr:AraC family transcriptional regulator ligand-binding domain-containing protein [Pseudomonadota bacterium]